ncbi:Hypothetical predicted protein, partial [Mytilus galloprovincialis]
LCKYTILVGKVYQNSSCMQYNQLPGAHIVAVANDIHAYISELNVVTTDTNRNITQSGCGRTNNFVIRVSLRTCCWTLNLN